MAQGVVIADAVVKFFADLSDYDQAIAGLTQLPQRLKPAQDAADSLGESFSAVGPAAAQSATAASSAGQSIAAAGNTGAAGIKNTDTAVQQLVARMKAMEVESAALQAQIVALQAKLAALGNEGQGAGRKMGSSFREAQGTAALLGEATGVHLPRHVRTFLATLPGISEALSGAFSAVAILFLIEAAVKLVEKFQEWRQEAELARAAWEAQTDSIEEHNDALRLANDELQKSLDKFGGKVSDNLAIALDTARVKADELAKSLTKDVEELQTLTQSQNVSLFDRILGSAGTGDIEDALKQKFDTIKKVIHDGKEAIREATNTGLPDETNRATTAAAIAEDQAYVDAIRYVVTELTKAKDAQDKFTAAQVEASKALSGRAASLALETGGEDQTKRIALLTSLLNNLQDAEDTASLSAKNLGLNIQKALQGDKGNGAADAAAQARRDLQEELGTIETVRTRQHLLFAEGKLDAADWALAQKRAADDSRDAQSKYQDKLVAIARTFSDGAKVQAASQEAVIEKTKLENQNVETLATSVEKHRLGVQKLYEEWDHLQQVSVAKLWNEATKASEELTKAEEKLTQAEKNLAVARAQSNASQQEAAIDRLAQFAIISEEEKEKRLKKIYDEEHKDAITALSATLAQEQKVVADYQSKLDSNPFFSDAQKKDLEKNLDEAKAKVLTTQAQIVKSDEEYLKKTDALATAQLVLGANIKKLLDDEIAANRVRLVSIETEILLAKAHGQNTSALEKEKQSVEQQTDALVKQNTAAGRMAIGLGRLASQAQRDMKNSGDAVAVFAASLAHTSSIAKAFGATMLDVYSQVEMAQQSALSSAIQGQKSWGDALAEGTKAELANVAARDLVWGFYWLGRAIADSFWNPPAASAEFTAAGILLAQGAVAAAFSYAIPNTQSSGGSSSGSSASVNTGANGQPGTQPSQGQNVPKLSGGGIVAVVGDAPGGGNAAEAIIPLENQRAKQVIADALVGNLVAAFSGVRRSDLPNFVPPELAAEIVSPQNFTRATLRAGAEAAALGGEGRSRPQTAINHHHYDQRTHVKVEIAMPIQGVISADTLEKVAPKIAKVISRQVKAGTTRLHSSTSGRTRKSQIKR